MSLNLNASASSVRQEHLVFASSRQHLNPTISALFPLPSLDKSSLLPQSAVLYLVVISTRPLSLPPPYLYFRDHYHQGVNLPPQTGHIQLGVGAPLLLYGHVPTIDCEES